MWQDMHGFAWDRNQQIDWSDRGLGWIAGCGGRIGWSGHRMVQSSGGGIDQLPVGWIDCGSRDGSKKAMA